MSRSILIVGAFMAATALASNNMNPINTTWGIPINGTDGSGRQSIQEELENTSTVNALKAMSMCVFFTFSVLVASAVIFLPNLKCCGTGNTSNTILSLTTCYSAGVFLTIGLTHLLGEATDILSEEYGETITSTYRPSYIIAIVGYLIMILLQKGVFREHGHSHDGSQPFGRFVEDEEPTAEDAEQEVVEPKHAPITVSAGPSCDTMENGSDEAEPTTTTTAPTVVTTSPDAVSEVDTVEEKPKFKKAGLAAVAASMAVLLIHSFVEGVALGIQDTSEGTLILFVAIVSHQWAEDVAVAAATGKAGYSPTTRMVLSLILGAAAPLGVGVGWAAKAVVPPVTEGFIVGFSAGTFIYISATEITSEELPASGKKSLWSRIAAIMVGVCTLYAVMVIVHDQTGGA